MGIHTVLNVCHQSEEPTQDNYGWMKKLTRQIRTLERSRVNVCLQDAMDRLMKGRTVLVIAHRLSTVQSADTVAVIAEGKVVEQGSHPQLLRSNGLYAALVRRQLQGTASSAVVGSALQTEKGKTAE